MLLPLDLENLVEAGCDEAGRGCLAGPVFAAAVILPQDFQLDGLNDSKQLSESVRERLRGVIEQQALAYSVVAVSAEEIDQTNILAASITAMQRALDQLSVRPEHIIVDGNKFRPYIDPVTKANIPYTCHVKGDAKYMSIAAASILAKTYRDEFMRKAAEQYPGYGWEHNYGYPTEAHRDAIRELGITPLHRKTYQLLPDPTLF